MARIAQIIKGVLAELLPHRKPVQSKPKPRVRRFWWDENRFVVELGPDEPFDADDLFEGEKLLEIEVTR
jgi:hypothetical protein